MKNPQLQKCNIFSRKASWCVGKNVAIAENRQQQSSLFNLHVVNITLLCMGQLLLCMPVGLCKRNSMTHKNTKLH